MLREKLYYNVPIIDVHFHTRLELSAEKSIEKMKRFSKEMGIERIAMLSLYLGGKDESTPSTQPLKFRKMQNLVNLFYKTQIPLSYAFASLEYKLDGTDTREKLGKQVEYFYKEGFDGIKMIEGKPNYLKGTKIPLNSDTYTDFYDFCEQNKFPIIMHQADPTASWNIKSASPEAIKEGWVFDSSFPQKDEIHEQVFCVMKKFPKLKMCLAHMGFFCDNIELLKRWLGDYENTMLDLTPGGEQFYLMHKNPKEWEKLLSQYQDRIMYGSDSYNFPEDWDKCLWAWSARHRIIWDFLERDESVKHYAGEIKGLKLPESVIRKFYYDNAYKYLGEPRKVNVELFKNDILKTIPENELEKEDLIFIKKTMNIR